MLGSHSSHLVGVVDAGVAGTAVHALKGRCTGQLEVPLLSLGHHGLGGRALQAQPAQGCGQLGLAKHLVRAAVNLVLHAGHWSTVRLVLGGLLVTGVL